MASRAFRFRLQRVLDYRETVERRVQSELAALEYERVRAEEALRQLEAEREDVLMQLVELQRGTLDPFEDGLLRAYGRDLDARIDGRIREVAELDRRIVAKREELIQASKGRKVMERLREQAWQAFIAEQLRVEQATLDEIGGQLFVRQRRDRPVAGDEASS